MAEIQIIPIVNPNDEYVYVGEWIKKKDEKIVKEDILCIVETTKAAIEITAEYEGYLYPLVKEGEEVKVKSPLAIIKKTSNENIDCLLKSITNEGKEKTEKKWTKKAEIVAKKHNIDIENISSDQIITESDVYAVLEDTIQKGKQIREKYSNQSLLILGGGNHAKKCMDILKRNNNFKIEGIIDKEIQINSEILGIKVVGRESKKDLERYRNNGIRYIVNAIGAVENFNTRIKVFEKIRETGLLQPNLIHPSAVVDQTVFLGEGVQIMPGAIIGSQAILEDNCMVNSNAVVSHDCVIGANTHIAPGAILAGDVSVGKNTLIGMGVTILQNVKIGSNVVIKNGENIFRNIKDRERI